MPTKHKDKEPGSVVANSMNSGLRTIFKAISGFLLAVYIIPVIGSSISNYHSLNNLQLQKRSELYFTHNQISNKIKTLTVNLVLYINYTDSLTFLEAQKDLRKDMNAAYLDFYKSAWCWLDNTKTEMYGYGFVNKQYDSKLSDVIERYKKNLTFTTQSLDTLWSLCLNTKVNPRSDSLQQCLVAKKTINSVRMLNDSLLYKYTELRDKEIDTIERYMFSKPIRFKDILIRSLLFQE